MNETRGLHRNRAAPGSRLDGLGGRVCEAQPAAMATGHAQGRHNTQALHVFPPQMAWEDTRRCQLVRQPATHDGTTDNERTKGHEMVCQAAAHAVGRASQT